MTRAGAMLVLGCGYSATALARRLIARGWRVIGTTRGDDGAARLSAEGIEPVIWPPGTTDLGPADHLLISTPPGEAGDPALAACGEAIASRAGAFRWAGYLSTTGVYGDHAGGWVDESAPLAPTTERGRRRLEAEAAWRDLAARSGLPLHIFRLAGIYGPGRGPFARLRAGTAKRIVKPGQVFGRIHRDDVAAALAASIRRPEPGAIYNLCDDEPAPPEDVIAYAAHLLGLPVPPAVPFAEADLSPMARSFYSESKRVSNRRLRERLGVALAYPTFREGLRADLGEEGR